MAGWQIKDLSGGEYVVTGPDGTEYKVTAHYEHSQSPIPEDAVHIDQITSNGVVLHDGRRVLVAHDAAITGLVEDAVLTAEGW